MTGMIQSFHSIRKCKNPPHSVRQFYFLHYHQIPKYSGLGYLVGLKKWHWQTIWYLFQNMFTFIIYPWRGLFHCLICISGWNPLPLHHHFNWIYIIPNYFSLRNIQCRSENHFTQSCRKSLCKFYHIYTQNGSKEIFQSIYQPQEIRKTYEFR